MDLQGRNGFAPLLTSLRRMAVESFKRHVSVNKHGGR